MVQSEFPEIHNEPMRILFECMGTCVACSKKCIEEGHKKTASLCAECADICILAIKALCAHSLFTDEIMELCTHACKKCSDECKKMQAQHCQECSDICGRCSEACFSERAVKNIR